MPDRQELVQTWARLDVVAPLDGVIIERNVALGELVDTTRDLVLDTLAYAATHPLR